MVLQSRRSDHTLCSAGDVIHPLLMVKRVVCMIKRDRFVDAICLLSSRYIAHSLILLSLIWVEFSYRGIAQYTVSVLLAC